MAYYIPKKVKIGRKEFRVERVKEIEGGHEGRILYKEKVIELDQYLTGEELWEAFLHEVVHGILRDMQRHDLNSERFVTAFSERLAQALGSK